MKHHLLHALVHFMMAAYYLHSPFPALLYITLGGLGLLPVYQRIKIKRQLRRTSKRTAENPLKQGPVDEDASQKTDRCKD